MRADQGPTFVSLATLETPYLVEHGLLRDLLAFEAQRVDRRRSPLDDRTLLIAANHQDCGDHHQELENENLWMRVEAVATALLEAQKLSASKIRSILKDPPISAQRLEQIMKYAMPIPFPDVSRIDVELTEEGPGTHFEARPRGFAWPQTYVGSIHCGNASICGGGLDLGVLIGEMVEDRSTLREIDTSCSGSEAEQACATRFKGSIRLRYVT